MKLNYETCLVGEKVTLVPYRKFQTVYLISSSEQRFPPFPTDHFHRLPLLLQVRNMFPSIMNG